MGNYFRRASLRGNKGFTLIEMAIVLVIIGLILGAVSVGKDLQRNAEYKKIKQKFVDQWAQAYNQFYEKYGVVLGDSEIEPTYAVCGDDDCNGTVGTHAAFLALGVSASSALSESEPGRICQTASFDNDSAGRSIAKGVGDDLHAYMDKAGIRMPPGRSEGREDRYLYLDTNGNPIEMQICFQWNESNTASGSGNMMVITGITPDLARALDQMIDGKPDAREGLFRQQNIANGAGDGDIGAAGRIWGNDNTQESTETVDGKLIAANTKENILDEDQIITVTAHYKMNQ